MKKLTTILTLTFICGFCFAKDLTVNIVPGKIWENRKPQCAVWICDSNGNYVDTIYVTNSAAKKGWKFSPKAGRPDSLPVWYFSANVNPASPAQNFDAVASATPKKSITVSHNVPLENGKTYIAYTEVNQSFDYNETYTKKNSGVNGQPSVVYSKEFIASNESFEIELDYTGTGSLDGSSGNISKSESSKLTSAQDIIAHVFVVIK